MVIKNAVSEEDLIQIEDCFNKTHQTEATWVDGSEERVHQKCVEHFLLKLHPIIEKAVGKKLKPVRTFMRKSFKGNILKRHLDKEFLNVTASLLVNKSNDNFNNPLIIHSRPKQEIYLERGDIALIINGHKIEHERPPIESDWMLSLYLHYQYDLEQKNKKTLI